MQVCAFSYLYRQDLGPKGILVAVWPERPGQSQISASLIGFPLCPPAYLANPTFPQLPWGLVLQEV